MIYFTVNGVFWGILPCWPLCFGSWPTFDLIYARLSPHLLDRWRALRIEELPMGSEKGDIVAHSQHLQKGRRKKEQKKKR